MWNGGWRRDGRPAFRCPGPHRDRVGHRRGLLALLTALPLIGGLFALLDPDSAQARKNRRKTRKKPHRRASRHRQKRKQRKKHKCKAHSRARTCANRCGTVRNNCKKKTDCGSCVCEGGCDICKTCNDRTGICEPDSAQQGLDCGEPGQICQADGTCACDASSCAPCETCQGDGTCSLPCDGEGCCAAGACVSGVDNAACGRNSDDCITCTGVGNTCGGGGQAGVCGCTPTSCEAEIKDCGTLDIGCGQTEDCGACPFPNQPCDDNVCGTCLPDCDGKACGADDGCGDPCLTGNCPDPDTCGGGGTPGVCGCTPDSDAVTCNGQCGTVQNNCNQPVDCVGQPCTPVDGGTNDAVCQANGRCCVPSGGACGGGEPLCGSAQNCCSGGCGCPNTCR